MRVYLPVLSLLIAILLAITLDWLDPRLKQWVLDLILQAQGNPFASAPRLFQALPIDVLFIVVLISFAWLNLAVFHPQKGVAIAFIAVGALLALYHPVLFVIPQTARHAILAVTWPLQRAIPLKLHSFTTFQSLAASLVGIGILLQLRKEKKRLDTGHPQQQSAA